MVKKGFKNFIGYGDDSEKIMLLCITFPKMSASKRDFDGTKYMSLLIKDIMKFRIKSTKLLKKDLIMSLYTTKNI